MNNYYLIDILVSITTFILMFGIGLSLTLSDFKNLLLRPAIIFLTLFSQMIVLPTIAILICYLSSLSQEFKLGIIILAASPGGTTSGFITYLLKGDVALSISLTIINSVLTLVTLPLIFTLGQKLLCIQKISFELPIIETYIHILINLILPTFLGVVIRFVKPLIAVKYEKRIKFIMIFLLIIVFSVKILANENNGGVNFQKNDFMLLLPIVVSFNICCLFFGYYFLRVSKQNHKISLTASIESSVHNTPFALLVTGTLIRNLEMTKPILIYALFSFWTIMIFGAILNKSAKG